MLWFQHPRPPSRKEVAVQMVAQKQEAAYDNTVITVESSTRDLSSLAAKGAGLANGEPIRFSVAYNFAEYRSMMTEQIARGLRKKRHPGNFAAGVALVAACCLPFMLGPWVAIIVAPGFFMRRRRMPVCDFTIDEEGIERVSAMGVWTRSWREVVTVQSLAPGFLVMFKHGAVPIPYRCLDAVQLQRMRALVVRHRRG